MTASAHSSGIDAIPPAKAAALSSLLESLAQGVKIWMNSCADYYAAATMYEYLSALSDAELNKRGLSRDTLALDVLNAAQVGSGPVDR